jgi:transcription elongation GreA/GreB family factor
MALFYLSSAGRLMKKLFSCKAKHDTNLASVKRKSISTDDKEAQEMYDHSNKQMDEEAKLRESVAKGYW